MRSPATTYQIEARVVRPGVSAATSKQEVIEFDTSAGQSDALPGPADLLTMAFAACVLKNVERFSQILPFRYENASIKVVSERQDTPPKMIRVTYLLRLVTDEPEKRVELLHLNIRRHGTIFNTLAATCEVSGEVLVKHPERRGAVRRRRNTGHPGEVVEQVGLHPFDRDTHPIISTSIQ